jgi:hypothetical protein
MSRRLVQNVLLAALLYAALSSSALADSIHLRASGATQFDPAIGAFVGIADVDAGGDSSVATATTYILSLQPLLNGMIVAQTSHRLDFGNGNAIATEDRALLIPAGSPGVYSLFSSMRIVGGTGAFQGATGHLTVLEGTVDLVTFSAAWDLRGTITPR